MAVAVGPDRARLPRRRTLRAQAAGSRCPAARHAAASCSLIWLGFDLLTGGLFLTARNLFNLSLQVAVVGIMACGMVLVIVSRHIDLSVGSQLGFIGVFGALLQTGILPIDGADTWWLDLPRHARGRAA